MEKTSKFTIALNVFFIGVLIGMFIGGLIIASKYRQKWIDCQKANPWWEMVVNECGYDEEKDEKNDYCRGFRDGYNYSWKMKDLDKQLNSQ